MYNYIEMRAHVNSKLFILRKHLDNFLQWVFPSSWIPLYTMVTFSTIPYHEVIDRRKKQDEVLSKTIKLFLAFGGMSLCTVVFFKLDKLKLPSMKVLDFKLPSLGFQFLSG
eukprot:Seg8137.1 transcript_id=Seg8137.1/GoldUCD/mRNA.D3Y31 product="Kynurenine 3-monooxygenase" protein_id=Seg8137.1/GoldUCD/D3Y31